MINGGGQPQGTPIPNFMKFLGPLKGNDWGAYSGDALLVYSIPATASRVPVNAPGAYLETRGPTARGWGRFEYSVNASGVSKSMTIELERNGVVVASNTRTPLSADSTTGTNEIVLFPIPAYSFAARYQWFWQGNTSGAGRNYYSRIRAMFIPSDRARLETPDDDATVVCDTSGTLTQGMPLFWSSDNHILRTFCKYPHRRGSARVVWSVNAPGASKVGTRLRLFRDARPFLPGVSTLYDSGSLSPGDSTAGTAIDTGVVTIQQCRYPALYYWSLDTPTTWALSRNNDNQRRMFISNGYISLPPLKK